MVIIEVFTMASAKSITKILFIDSDEVSFQFRKCMATVLQQLPPMELFHASDATEGLSILENIQPDVVVLDDEILDECHLFLDSLQESHPPVILQTDARTKSSTEQFGSVFVTYLPKDESLAGVHETLKFVTSMATHSGPSMH